MKVLGNYDLQFLRYANVNLEKLSSLRKFHFWPLISRSNIDPRPKNAPPIASIVERDPSVFFSRSSTTLSFETRVWGAVASTPLHVRVMKIGVDGRGLSGLCIYTFMSDVSVYSHIMAASKENMFWKFYIKFILVQCFNFFYAYKYIISKKFSI